MIWSLGEKRKGREVAASRLRLQYPRLSRTPVTSHRELCTRVRPRRSRPGLASFPDPPSSETLSPSPYWTLRRPQRPRSHFSPGISQRTSGRVVDRKFAGRVPESVGSQRSPHPRTPKLAKL